MRLSICSALSIFTFWAQAQTAQTVKWACIGNSITQGVGLAATDAYPEKLGALLGPGYLVQNDGVSGRTLLKKGDFSYWTQGKLGDVFKLQPDIISIKLGTNDSKPINWNTHKGEFEGDLTRLIDTLSAMPSKPKIFLVIPCPAFVDQTGDAGIRGSIIKSEIIPLIKKVAAAKGLDIIDANTPLLNSKALFTDGIHPNAQGHDSLAAIFYRTYVAKAIRVACVGNSITEYAFGTPGTVAKDAYPIKLGNLLGPGYYAVNYGKSGAYMQKVSPRPYWGTGNIKKVIDLKPNIITIKLGTNDSRAQAWHSDKYIADYKSLIDTFSTIAPKPKIWLLLPCPAWKRNGIWPYTGISGDIIRDSVIPAIKSIAADKGLTTIDLNTPMLAHEALVPDGVHPGAEGQDSLAHWIYRALIVPTGIAPPEGRAPALAARSLFPETDLRAGTLYVTYPERVPGTIRLYGLGGSLLASAALLSGEASPLSLRGIPAGACFLSVETPRGRAFKRLNLDAGNRIR